ncbi:uncharacterized protein LOC126678302 [Mercurialis annua]|uniref:uncharacterized protein LOC126678302 n=1 Tax=Mercurialis annua TaxID=3986 RepID=UPI00215FC52D|nr:uncharacterized protein LOC126678302 [Mercurialis annua]
MNKRSWKQRGTIFLTESCNYIIQSNLPTKLKDPGSFTIHCTIGNMNSINCLCDLGASINLMPLFLFRSLFGAQPVKHTSLVFQLADHSLKKLYAIVEDVLVKVDKFIFPLDFMMLDYAVDKECPMILVRPFMNTGCALIDVHAEKLTLRIDEEKVEFDMKRVMRNTLEKKECMGIDLVVFQSDGIDDEYSEDDEPKQKILIKKGGITPSSSKVPPTCEMKPLPTHLWYAFVGENKILPIIISNKLSEAQEKRVV